MGLFKGRAEPFDLDGQEAIGSLSAGGGARRYIWWIRVRRGSRAGAQDKKGGVTTTAPVRAGVSGGGRAARRSHSPKQSVDCVRRWAVRKFLGRFRWAGRARLGVVLALMRVWSGGLIPVRPATSPRAPTLGDILTGSPGQPWACRRDGGLMR